MMNMTHKKSQSITERLLMKRHITYKLAMTISLTNLSPSDFFFFCTGALVGWGGCFAFLFARLIASLISISILRFSFLRAKFLWIWAICWGVASFALTGSIVLLSFPATKDWISLVEIITVFDFTIAVNPPKKDGNVGEFLDDLFALCGFAVNVGHLHYLLSWSLKYATTRLCTWEIAQWSQLRWIPLLQQQLQEYWKERFASLMLLASYW